MIYQPTIVYEDNHLLIVSKCPGEIVQGDKTGDEPLVDKLREYLRVKYNKPGQAFLGLVNRIDRPVGGLIIFAKTSKALSRLNAMLQRGEIHKTYWAIVQTHPPKQTERLTHHLVRREQSNKSFAYSEPRGGSKESSLTYRLLASTERYHLLEIDLHTGRHHQIRAQLSAIGCPIRGDLKYGAKRSNLDGSISLLSRYLKFVHPVSGEELCLSAPLPRDVLWQTLEKLSPQDPEQSTEPLAR